MSIEPRRSTRPTKGIAPDRLIESAMSGSESPGAERAMDIDEIPPPVQLPAPSAPKRPRPEEGHDIRRQHLASELTKKNHEVEELRQVLLKQAADLSAHNAANTVKSAKIASQDTQIEMMRTEINELRDLVHSVNVHNVELRKKNEILEMKQTQLVTHTPNTGVGNLPSIQNPEHQSAHDIQLAEMAAQIAQIQARIPTMQATSSVLTPNTLHTATTSSASSQSALYGHKKLIDLPTFTGRPEEWLMFMAAYQNTTAAYGYDAVDNTFRMQRCLTGAARDAVVSMLNDSRNIEAVLETLEMLYGQPAMLIQCELDKVKSIAPIQPDRLEQWAPFAAKVRNLAATLETDRTNNHLRNPVLINKLVQKLPTADRLAWSDVAAELPQGPTVRDLADWLIKAAKRACRVAPLPADSPLATQRRTGSDRRFTRPNVVLLTEPTDYSPAACTYCHGQHVTAECPEYRLLDATARMNEAQRLRMCFRCLKSGHTLRYCRSRNRCEIDACESRHHTLLHGHDDTNPSTATVAPEASPQLPLHLSGTTRTKSEPQLLMRVVAVRLCGPNRSVATFALFDEAAKVTLIDESLADELELNGESSTLNLAWYGGRSSTEQSRAVNLTIRGTDNKAFDVKNAYTVKNLQLPQQTLSISTLQSKFHHLKNIPIADFTDATPRILLGLDHCSLGTPRRVIEAADGRLVAALTRLGWIVYGGEGGDKKHASHQMLLTCKSGEEDLHEVVRQFQTTESFGVRGCKLPLESKADSRARLLLATTTIRKGNHFETGLLWASDAVSLPPSRAMAISRLGSIELKMSRDARFADLYKKNIQNYLAKGYARKLSDAEAAKETPRTWYLPHFGVENPNKPGKVRLVFDAAAKVRGVSLNSELLTGPDEFASLVQILHQFRLGAIGVSGDIQEMFHQITIRAEDQNAQRFVWRDGDRSKPVETYVMQAMTFGARCSPCSAQFIKNLNASEIQDADPKAVSAIVHHHYVDDYVMSFRSAAEASKTTKNVIEIHRRGGFNIRNFRSNSPEVLRDLGCDNIGEPIDLRLEEAPEKILGMCWDSKSDEFTFKVNLHHIAEDVAKLRKPPTKRQILSVAMSVFDPFGVLCDFMLHAKLMVQDIWRLACGWDDPIPHEIERKWTPWFLELKKVELCRISRCYSPHLLDGGDVQLHIFADASEAAFAAVAYWRVTRNSGEIDVAFIVGKTRCAPLKMLTIPRLELQAAVLATRLKTSVLECHQIPVSRTFLWSDSTTVLKWIEADHRRYKPFVAARVAEILEASTEDEWRYIPTAANVADDATRAKSIRFSKDSRWIRGPDLLRGKQCDWPRRPNITIEGEEEELRARYVLISTPPPIPLIEVKRFVRYECITRVLAWALRFTHNTRKHKDVRQKGALNAEELRKAGDWLCRMVQEEAYAEEHAALTRGEDVSPRSKIHNLQPYLDNVGTLRLRGRTDTANAMPEETRRPIIMPKAHHVTRLIVEAAHRSLRHQNQAATVCFVRQRFWIPQLRNLVRRITDQCQFCKIKKARPNQPQMGQLPEDRVTPFVRPFTHTGLDYFGPLAVAVGRRREKRWVALFSCLTTRALHLELAADLTADACILCIRNFINMRGVPLTLRSDNGTNFVGADKILRNFSEELTSGKIGDELSSKGVKWTFNSPSNPEAGGCWERMVQCVKRVLAVTLVEAAPRVETLRSLLLEAANIVNSRPLTHLPVEPDCEEPLTPNHFLLGGASRTQTPAPVDEREMCSRKQWRVLQQMKNAFWRRWIKEYLPELTRRTKWHRDSPSLQIGDLVIICDDDVSCGGWRRGRVEAVFPGPDGRVRNCAVRTAGGVLRRPASRLAKLDVAVQP